MLILTVIIGFSMLSACVTAKENSHQQRVKKQAEKAVKEQKQVPSYLHKNLLKQASEGKLLTIPFHLGDTYKNVKKQLKGKKYSDTGPNEAYNQDAFILYYGDAEIVIHPEKPKLNDTDKITVLRVKKKGLTTDMIIKALGAPSYSDTATKLWELKYKAGKNTLHFESYDYGKDKGVLIYVMSPNIPSREDDHGEHEE